MTYSLQNVAVFCGSSVGKNPAFMEAAIALGKELSARRIGLVYGGGSVGLMGILADTVLAAKGSVIGVIPQALDNREITHLELTELHIVDSMHARKALMAAKANAFIALPGGYGTLDELLETITWLQLGIQVKPIAIYNVNGYFDPLLDLFQRMVDEGFISQYGRTLVTVGKSPAEVLDLLASFEPANHQPKWTNLAL